MTQCAQRTGFLTFTMCGEPAVAVCANCGKPICANHLQGDLSGPRCPDCAVIGLDPDEASRRGLDSSYHRWSSSHYTDTGTYTPSDYDNFDSGGGEMAGGGAGDDWDDSGDVDDSDSGSDSDSDGESGGFQDS